MMHSRFSPHLRNALMALALLVLLCQTHLAGAQANGGIPQAILTVGKDGNFYGTAPLRGDYGYEDNGLGYGTVFKITPQGSFTRLYAFNQADGAYPFGGLVLGPDGNFYGTTYSGGDDVQGTIFKITPSGTLTTLYSFSGPDGSMPFAGVTVDSSGNLYGTTTLGGDYNYGTIFKLAPDGTLTTLHSFNGRDGLNPWVRLTLEQGVLYGNTSFGGPEATLDTPRYGTIFKITTDGQFTNLYTFNGIDGKWPAGSLTMGKDGNFYGTTEMGGAWNAGIVYKITSNGVLTNIHSFDATLGLYPEGKLLRDVKNDCFYGATVNSTSPGYPGVLYKICYDGSVTFLHTFTNDEGCFSFGGLTWGWDGKIYGTGYQGGANGLGTIFKFSLPGTFTKLFDF